MRKSRSRKAKRNAKIIAFYKANKWSYQLVADKFGVTRHVVAGLIFRDTYPSPVCFKKTGRTNKIGTGHRGRHHEPKYTTRNSDARWAPRVRSIMSDEDRRAGV